jgi:hypothetical protein
VNDFWLDKSIEFVIGGKSPDNVRYLKMFLADYVKEFGGTPNAGCSKCIKDYLKKYKKKLENMSKTKTNCDYELKAKYEGLQIGLTGRTVNNRNITNELAQELLCYHEASKIFSKFPEGAKAKASESTGTNADIFKAEGFKPKQATKDQLIAFAQKHNIEIPTGDEAVKPQIMDAVIAWGAVPTSNTPAVDVTNNQFAKADGFDVETATDEAKADFIEKYNIPFTPKENGEAFSSEEVTELIKAWLAEDTLA